MIGMEPGRTLASLAPGETARVDRILFGALRTVCGDLGLFEGESVHCRAGTSGVLVLDTQDGRIISLARDWARYINVAPPLPNAA
jgi:hypothetical protein